MAGLSMMTWAIGFPVAELLLRDWSPLFLITVRMTLAIAFMIPVWMIIEGLPRLTKRQFVRGLVTGGIGFGVGAHLMLVAQDLTDPVTVALISATAPVAGALLEMRAGTRRITRRFMIGLAATVAGGFIATNGLPSGQLGLGAAYAVCAVFLWTWASMAVNRDLPTLGPIGRSTLTFTGGAFALWVMAAGTFVSGSLVLPSEPISVEQIQLLLIYTVIAMAISQVLWIASVGKLGVALACFHMNLTPFFVMLIMVGLGAGWYWPQAYGAALVGIGVLIAQKKRRKAPRETEVISHTP